MPKGPGGETRPADAVARAAMIAKIATGEIEKNRELIRKDRDRHGLRRMLLDGAESAPGSPGDGAYFDALRESARHPGSPRDLED